MKKVNKKDVLIKYNVKKIAEELYDKWKDYNSTGLGVAVPQNKQQIQEEAEKAEKFVLGSLKKVNSDWTFTLTQASRTPADIVGLKQNNNSLYFLLIQVKYGTSKYINECHQERETLPHLKEMLKQILEKERRNIIISTCFILIEKQTNKSAIKYANTKVNDFKHYYKNGNSPSKIEKDNQKKVVINAFNNYLNK